MNVKFLHVPKTAGSSVRWFLRRFFKPEEVCPAAYSRQLRKMPVEQLRTYRMFAGHFDWVDLDRIEGPCSRERMPIGQVTEGELLARANRNLDLLDGLYSTDDLHPLKKDIIATLGARGIARWQTIPSWFYPIQRVRRNQNSGHFASRMAELKSLGATHRTFDRIEEMTRLDRIIWTERFHRAASMRATPWDGMG